MCTSSSQFFFCDLYSSMSGPFRGTVRIASTLHDGIEMASRRQGRHAAREEVQRAAQLQVTLRFHMSQCCRLNSSSAQRERWKTKSELPKKSVPPPDANALLLEVAVTRMARLAQPRARIVSMPDWLQQPIM